MDKCKRCGNIIFGTKSYPRADGTIGTSPDFIRGEGNDMFCLFCATTCFFIDGMMYSSEELKEVKLTKSD